MDKQKLYDKGIGKAKLIDVIKENILFILMLCLGFLGMKPFQINGWPVVSILYAAFGIWMLGFFLRKHLCTHCYYYDKLCHCGWGRLASALYKKGSGNQALGYRLVLPVWGILMFLPVLMMILALAMKKITMDEQAVYLLPFISIVIMNGILHNVDCKECKMKFICPGSPEKK